MNINLEDQSVKLEILVQSFAGLKRIFTELVLPGVLNLLTLNTDESAFQSFDAFLQRYTAGDKDHLQLVRACSATMSNDDFLNRNLRAMDFVHMRNVLELLFKEEGMDVAIIPTAMFFAYIYIHAPGGNRADLLWFNIVLVSPARAKQLRSIAERPLRAPVNWKLVRVSQGSVYVVVRRKMASRILGIICYLATWIYVAVATTATTGESFWGEYFFKINESVSYGLMYLAVAGLSTFPSVSHLKNWIFGWERITSFGQLAERIHEDKSELLVCASRIPHVGAVFADGCSAIRVRGVDEHGDISGKNLFTVQDAAKYGYIFFDHDVCFDFFRGELVSWELHDNGVYHINGNILTSLPVSKAGQVVGGCFSHIVDSPTLFIM